MAFVLTAPGDGHWSSIIQSGPGSAESINVPDAELLFRGEFKRVGPDLVLTDDHGRHHLIVGYFSSEHPPALVAPNGASLSAHLVQLLAGSSTAQHYAQAQPADHANAIGTVEKVVGDATAIRNGVSVTLQVGDAIYRSDVVQTGTASSVGVGFPDGTALNLIANTRMAMSDYSFDPNSNSNNAVFDLVEGTFSFVAGKVAHTGNMKIGTPVATMGIRGTTGWVEQQVATITATLGATAYSFAVANDFGVDTHGLYDLFDQSGDVIATVSQTGYVTFVTPQGPGQPPLVTVQPMTNTEFAFEQQILQQVFQTLNLISLPAPHSNPDNGSSTPPNQLDNPQLLLLENSNHSTTISFPSDSSGGPVTVPAVINVTVDVSTTIVAPPTVAPANSAGVEGSAINLNVGVSTLSGDALASLIISAVPVGATLSDGHGHSFTATSGFTAVDVHTWNVSDLTITPSNDLNFTLNVSATQENANGTSTAAVNSIDVSVSPLAPSVNPVAVSGNVNMPINLNLGVTTNELSGANGDALNTNTLASLVIGGIPIGAVLSDAHGHSFTASGTDSSVDIDGWDVADLTLTADQAGLINLSVTATEKGPQGNLSSSTTGTEAVNVSSPGWVGNTLQEDFYFPNAATNVYTSPTFVAPASGILGSSDDVFVLALTASTITLQFIANGGFIGSAFNGFAIFDLSNNPLISGVTIDPTTNMAGFNSSDISFDSTSVWVNLANLHFTSNTVVTLDLTFDPPLNPSDVLISQALDGSTTPAINSADLSVQNGSELALVGTIDNSGAILVGGSSAATAIGVDGTVTLEGGGHIELSSSNENYIFGSTLINVDNTISGGGDIGNGSMIFENAGVVEAQGPYALIIDTGTNAFVNTGIIEAHSGTLVVDSPVTGHGQAVVDGGTLEFSKASDSTVSFASGSTGNLILDQSENFSGHIVGFGNGDKIDLSDVSFSGSTSVAYASGHLTVSDGTTSVSLSIDGDYSPSSFSIATDGHGGTLVTDDAATNSPAAAANNATANIPTTTSANGASPAAIDQILPANYVPSNNSGGTANQGGSVAVAGHGGDTFVFPSPSQPGTDTMAAWQNDGSHHDASADSHLQSAAWEPPADYGSPAADQTHADLATQIGVDPAQHYALMQSTVHLH